ncbi:hypothetical protein MMC11_007540 [Xylographa trunciseda]|nr:hypothetical protein [Xylographa trunciseda]
MLELGLEPPSTPLSSSRQLQEENAVSNSFTPRADTSSATNPSPLSQHMVPDSQPSSIAAPLGSLPPQLLSLFSAIQKTLMSEFSISPPHTVQRLAELVLRPSSHYRTLPAYLRALDRVLSVSSTANVFPLPSIATNNTKENGVGEAASYLGAARGPVAHTQMRDEFSGAALTRIPWLREPHHMLMNKDRQLAGDLRTESTSLIDGPNGAGSLETVTVSVNGMTRTMKRDPLGLVTTQSENGLPGSEAVQSGRITRSSTASALAKKEEEEADEEKVHARGPDEIGVEDMGPQATDRADRGFDVEAALGRPGEGEDMDGKGLSAEREKKQSDGERERKLETETGNRGNEGRGNEGKTNTGKNGLAQQNLVDTSAL